MAPKPIIVMDLLLGRSRGRQRQQPRKPLAPQIAASSGPSSTAVFTLTGLFGDLGKTRKLS